MSAGQRRPIDCGLVRLGGLLLVAAGWAGSGGARCPGGRDRVAGRGPGPGQGRSRTRRTRSASRCSCYKGGIRSHSRRTRSSTSSARRARWTTTWSSERRLAATADAQYELGSWCEQNRLPDLAKLHYESALALDPEHEAAHKKLGHTKVEGSWLTRDDLSAAQGLVKYKGRWVTAEEKTKRDAADKLSAAQGSWLRRIRMLRQAIVNGPDDRRREAESQLMAIRDPDAVVPLVRVFGQDDAPRRVLLALVLSTIGGPEATSALIERVLDEPDSEVRSITFEHLKQRDDAGIAGRFVRALGREDIKVINRAAWALGNLNSPGIRPPSGHRPGDLGGSDRRAHPRQRSPRTSPGRAA